MVKCLYSVFAFLPILQCLCIHIVYIYIYIFYRLALKFITIFKVPFTFLVPRGLGCLCSAPQPPSHTETYAAVKLKGKPGNQWHQNLNASPNPCTVYCHLQWPTNQTTVSCTLYLLSCPPCVEGTNCLTTTILSFCYCRSLSSQLTLWKLAYPSLAARTIMRISHRGVRN